MIKIISATYNGIKGIDLLLKNQVNKVSIANVNWRPSDWLAHLHGRKNEPEDQIPSH